MINELLVCDQEGIVLSYEMSFISFSAYGTFFLDDVLYIGFGGSDLATHPNSLVPVIIDENGAFLGSPIPFHSENFSDMASCNESYPYFASVSKLYRKETGLFP